MPSRYGKPAIEFRQSIRKGAIFRVFDEPAHLPLRGQTLTIYGTILMPRNPDDHLYEVKDGNRVSHQIRGWWLRRHSARVD